MASEPATTAAAGSKNPEQARLGTKITLHWLEKSRAQRTLWLLEELNLDYELKIYKREADMRADPALKQVHALGKSPIIGVQGRHQAKETILAETGALTEYLTDYFGRHLIPARYPAPATDAFNTDPTGPSSTFADTAASGEPVDETDEYLRYKYYLHYAEGSLMTAMILALITSFIRTAKVPFFVKPITKAVADRIDGQFVLKNIQTHLDFCEAEMKGHDFFAGPRLTGADFIMIFPLSAAKNRGLVTEKQHPNLCAYVERMEAREAYKRGVQKIVDATGGYNPNI